MSSSSVSGSSGIFAVVVGTLAVSVIITKVTGSVAHWPFILAGIGVGLYAVKAMNR